MSAAVEQFPYLPRAVVFGSASLAPLLPITLLGSQPIPVTGLVDSGAAINVLPYSVGVQLGADWDKQTPTIQLTGNLANVEARVLVMSAVVAGFAPVRLAFAWAKTDTSPLLLGQVNFFMEFEVCFFRAREMFEVRPKK